jgi:hypothetical protein
MLSCDGFQLNVYDGDSLVLLEASPEGAFEVSGFRGMDEDPGIWNGLNIPDDNLDCGFRLIEVPAALAGRLGDDCRMAYEKVANLLAGDSAEHCDNLVQVETLGFHRELGIPGARELYFRKVAD